MSPIWYGVLFAILAIFLAGVLSLSLGEGEGEGEGVGECECKGKAKGFIQTYSAADGNVVVRGLRIAASNLPLLLTARMNQHFLILTKKQSRGVTKKSFHLYIQSSGKHCLYIYGGRVEVWVAFSVCTYHWNGLQFWVRKA